MNRYCFLLIERIYCFHQIALLVVFFFESHTIPVLICCITISKLGKVNIVFLFICFWSRWNPCEFEHRSWRGVLDTTLWDKVCQWLATDRWFSPGTLVSSTNKFDSHDIIQLSPLLECDPTVCLLEKSKVTRGWPNKPSGDLTFLWETNRRVTLQQGW
jgi:hypothetical protein